MIVDHWAVLAQPGGQGALCVGVVVGRGIGGGMGWGGEGKTTTKKQLSSVFWRLLLPGCFLFYFYDLIK